jgi:hypothetical protein
MDPAAILRAKKAKILADAKAAAAKLVAAAQLEADAVDADMRLFEQLRPLADKYGLDLVEKANGHGGEEAIAVNLDAPAYKAAIAVAEQALKAAGHPLELSELFDACESIGVRLGGKRPQSTLSAYLSSSHSTVQSIRKGVYWLKNVPVPP